jgi:predicted  nucleic acid-binding Zn-ribbon protein
MKKEQIEKEYEKDYEYAIKHPVKGVKCGKCWEVYYHPVLGCAKCGKYSYKYKSEESKEEQISDSWSIEFDEKFITKQIKNGYTEICDFECSTETPLLIKSFIKQTLAKQKIEIDKSWQEKVKEYIDEVDKHCIIALEKVEIIEKQLGLTNGK